MISITEKDALKASALFNIDELKDEIKYWKKEKFLLPFGFYLDYYGHKKSLIKYFILMASFLTIFLIATILGSLVIPFAGQIASLSLLGGLISFVFFLPAINSRIKNHITKEEIQKRLKVLISELESEQQILLSLNKQNNSTADQIIPNKEKQTQVTSNESFKSIPTIIYKSINTYDESFLETKKDQVLKRER